MSLSGQIETRLELKTPANKLNDFCKLQNCINRNETTTEKLAVDVEGELGKNGCLIASRAGCGKSMNNKVTLQKMDDQNTKSYCKVIEGDLLKNYKNFNYSVQVIPKDEGSSMVWTVEYEKMNKDVREPKEFIDYCASLTKEADRFMSIKKSMA